MKGVANILSRGKSGRQKSAMIAELRKDVRLQRDRAEKWKKMYKELKSLNLDKKLLLEKQRKLKHVKDKLNLKIKISNRDNRLASYEQEIEELELTIKKRERDLARLEREKEKQSEVLEEVRQRKRKVVVKEVTAPLSPEAKRLEKLAKSGVDERLIKTGEYVERTATFLAKHSLSAEQLAVLTKAQQLEHIRTADAGVSYKKLNKLVEMGYLQSSNSVGPAKYWFLSLDGKKLMEQYKSVLRFRGQDGRK